ncbi:MAG: glycoside hydrolase family 3 C-terminal domain-containing protein [Bacteroidota bacterium]
MKKYIFLTCVSTVLLISGCSKPGEVSGPKLSADNIDEVISAMTLDEKILLLKGTGMKSMIGMGTAVGDTDKDVKGAAGTTTPIPRLGIPAVIFADGPAGLRISPERKGKDRTFYCTAFPVGTLLASSWDAGLVEEVGKAMGNEAVEYGVDVILGPGVNIQRNPLCGRNYEYYSEDPFLTGIMGTSMVNGIESNQVGASVKHYLANNQETNRNANNAIVSQRALREIYMKGYEMIVGNSQPWTIMSSYNKLNGTYTSESREVMTDILRGEWGFEGLVMSDWFGGKDAVAQIGAGNDLLEPGLKRQYKAIKKAVENGTLPVEYVDASVRRVLELVLKSRKMENNSYSNNPDLKAHAVLTRWSAAEGMILLKNDGTLPLTGNKNVALFGVTSYDFISGGTGAGDVNEAYTISLVQGLQNSDYTVNAVAKEIFEKHKAENIKAFKKPKGTLAAMRNPYHPPEYLPAPGQLSECASEADAAIITIGRNSGEAQDRVEKDDFLLSDIEQNLISTVCESFHSAGKKVVVVLNIAGVIEIASWKAKPDAILLAWQGGQEGGNSVADILCGKVNPSGKLPMTFPVTLADHASTENFPTDGRPMKLGFTGGKEKPEAEQEHNVDYTIYEEGIYVGYRHFDKKGLDVSYPFGYGLSFTQFVYDKMDVEVTGDTININVTVNNSGNIPGKEIVQIYVSKPDTQIDRPVQELKAFAKTPLLGTGEAITLTMQIPVSELSYWNEVKSEWTLETGAYTINAASSSREIRLSEEISL